MGDLCRRPSVYLLENELLEGSPPTTISRDGPPGPALHPLQTISSVFWLASSYTTTKTPSHRARSQPGVL
jgi:hypothetical protein